MTRGRLFVLLSASAALIAASTATPIFPLALGGVLALIDRATPTGGAPNFYIMLGGGLTEERGVIKLNAYSQKRLDALQSALNQQPLPVLLSGVESPWAARALSSTDDSINPDGLTIAQRATFYRTLDAAHIQSQSQLQPRQSTNAAAPILAETASMNTCENARFTQALLAAHNVANPSAYLITDWYHVPRARRQFAKVGIATTPIIAPMPKPLAWLDGRANLSHSRRALYETAALIRDWLRPQPNCRTPLPLDKLTRANGNPKTFADKIAPIGVLNDDLDSHYPADNPISSSAAGHASDQLRGAP